MTAPAPAPAPAPVPAPRPRPGTGATTGPGRPDLRVVEDARRSRAGIYGALVATLIFGTLFLNAGFHTLLVSGQQRLDTLNDRVLEQQKLNQRKRVEVAGLESPDRIVQAAKKDNMVLPDEVHWLSPGPEPGSAIASTSERAEPPVTAPVTTVGATAADEPADELAAGTAGTAGTTGTAGNNPTAPDTTGDR